MKQYTVGFIYDSDFSHVLLVHKIAPDWQCGLLNGVGGKRELGENGRECFVREVKEETNIDLKIDEVTTIGFLEDPNGRVEVFGANFQGVLFDAMVFEKEKIEWFSVDRLPENVIPNLKWLIPLTIEKLRNNKIKDCLVRYHSF